MEGQKTAFFSRRYLRKPLTSDTGVFCYIRVNEPEARFLEVWHTPPQTPCTYSHTHTNKTVLKGNL